MNIKTPWLAFILAGLVIIDSGQPNLQDQKKINPVIDCS